MEKNKNKNKVKNIFSDPYSDKKQEPGKLQGRAIGIFIIAGILVIVFSAWQINKQLIGPFKINTNSASTHSASQVADTTNTGQIARLEDLRDKDTDHDGLSDYDELYIFSTSPYIADSDSDKIDDQAEVNQGTNPNCPEGVECSRAVLSNENTNTNTAFEELKPTNEEAQQTDLSNLTAAQLREIARDAGASEEVLSQLSDEELLEAYQQIMEQEGTATGNTNTNTGSAANTSSLNTDSSAVSYDDLAALSAEDIRQLLIEGGVPKETLDLVDDQTLQQIYLESLEENLGQL